MTQEHLVAVSPHLDDAAFSAGGTLAAHVRRGGRVTVVTCFTGNVAQPKGFALACQLDKGLPPDVDYMHLRRQEDSRAWSVIGADVVHLPFLEAPHRGYHCAAALFDARLPDDDAVEALAPALAHVVADAASVLGPLAIGDHVDHHIVREALQRVVAPHRLLLWEDWPYLDRAERLPPSPARIIDLDDELLATRMAMCAAYESQLRFQFGGRDAMDQRLTAITRERLHAPSVLTP